MNGMAATLRIAERIVSVRSHPRGSSTGEVLAMANAALSLQAALERIAEVDRTAAYEPGEARPDGTPAPPGGRWLTPREIADLALGRAHLATTQSNGTKGESDGEENHQG